MAEQHTNPHDYLASIEHERKREDAQAILKLMQEVTGKEPVMWGSIVGFGKYYYKLANGKTGESLLTGFAPRKANIVLYIMAGFDEYDDLLSKLGKHKTGKACLYINKLADVDQDVLRELVNRSMAHMQATNETE